MKLAGVRRKILRSIRGVSCPCAQARDWVLLDSPLRGLARLPGGVAQVSYVGRAAGSGCDRCNVEEVGKFQFGESDFVMVFELHHRMTIFCRPEQLSTRRLGRALPPGNGRDCATVYASGSLRLSRSWNRQSPRRATPCADPAFCGGFSIAGSLRTLTHSQRVPRVAMLGMHDLCGSFRTSHGQPNPGSMPARMQRMRCGMPAMRGGMPPGG